MHPLLARPTRLFVYLVAWLALGLLLAFVFAWSVPLPYARGLLIAGPLTLAYGLVCLSAFWVCRSNPLAGAPPWRITLTQLGAAAQASAVWVVLGALWRLVLDRVLRPDGSGVESSRTLAMLFATGLPLYLGSAAAYYLASAVVASRAADRRALESQVHARDAELRALRAQLNPHFLFNSLNSINALIGKDPEGARRMCERLGEFLRLTLHLGGRESVPLSEELALVDRYLSVEQVRFGARLVVERQIDPEALSCMLPPLLLQPLVENAVKHGVARRLDPGVVRMAALRRGGQLILSIESPIDAGEPSDSGTGTGLTNVRRRLAVLGGGGASLTVTRPAGLFRVVLSLEAREAARLEESHA